MDAVSQANEQVLVLRCQAGEEQAFIDLFTRYHAPLKYYLRRMLGSPERADDALQEVWLQVLCGIRRLRTPKAFRAWLYRVARNEALQELRRNGRWSEMEHTAPLYEGQHEQGDEIDPCDAEQIHMALDKIAPLHRDVLTLRFMEDMPYDEIASVLGCEVGTVRSRLYYAKRHLRKAMEELDNVD